MDKEAFVSIVIKGLERILFEGVYRVPHNFVIFDLDPKYFIQIVGGRGDMKVRCEAVGNGYMITDDFISEDQIKRLLDLGWSESSGEENHAIELPCDSIDGRRKLAELFYETAKIYEACAIEKVQVHIGNIE